MFASITPQNYIKMYGKNFSWNIICGQVKIGMNITSQLYITKNRVCVPARKIWVYKLVAAGQRSPSCVSEYHEFPTQIFQCAFDFHQLVNSLQPRLKSTNFFQWGYLKSQSWRSEREYWTGDLEYWSKNSKVFLFEFNEAVLYL